MSQGFRFRQKMSCTFEGHWWKYLLMKTINTAAGWGTFGCNGLAPKQSTLSFVRIPTHKKMFRTLSVTASNKLFTFKLPCEFFSEQEIDGRALIYLAREGSFKQLEACGLLKVGDQLRLKEFIAEVPVVSQGRRNKKPSISEIKAKPKLDQRIYKAK